MDFLSEDSPFELSPSELEGDDDFEEIDEDPKDVGDESDFCGPV